jgi:Protein kinase domain
MTTAIGGYELESELGQGATGTVYVARPAGSGEPVALKVLSPALASDPAFRTRFRREAEIMKRLADPHCVGVYDYGDDDTPWIAMEYVHGATLRAVLDRADKLTPAQACGVMLGALAGLGHAHDLGVVHRDVKPENVLVDAHGESKLADFGLVADRVEVNDWRAIEGSPAYMSPEQVRGEPLDPRSDLYACGAVLYELLTGHAPYSAESPLAMLHAQVDAPTPNTASLPNRIATVVTRALAKDPNERPATAAEFAAELTDAADNDLGPLWLASAGIAGIVAAATTIELAEHARRRRSRRVRIGVAAGLVAALVVVGAIIAAASSSSHTHPIATPSTNTVRPTAATSTTATPSTRASIVPLVDPCVVGHWHATSATSYYKNFDSGKTDPTVGGAGSTDTVNAAGRYVVDNAAEAPFYGTDAGRVLIMTFRGRLTGTLKARHGVEHTTTTTSTLSLAVTIGGQPINNARVVPGASTSTYTCNASSYIEHNSDGTETTWVRS